MTQLDLLILTIYVITVVYVLYQMIESLETKTVIKFDKATVDRQLEERDIQDLVDIKFKFEDRYDFKNPKTLAVTVQNKSDHSSIYVDWDLCTLSDYGGRSRRVVRITPNKRTEDLFQPQMSSTVTPGTSLSETITAEDLLKQNADGALEPSTPLVDIEKLEKSAQSPKATDAQKKMYGEFMEGLAPIPFTLQLALRIRSLTSDTGADFFHTIACPFAMSLLPWHDALPFNPKK